jgi:VIT1/CCC1 family predicted Fe2+/Mn2+ transporter
MGVTEIASATPSQKTKRLLAPIDRISEILFGLIMVITITCSLSVARRDHKEIREMIVAALGCNIAWGVIDGIFYLIIRFSEQGRSIKTLQSLRVTNDSSKARKLIADALPPLLASVLTPADFEMIHERLNRTPNPPSRPHIAKNDWLAALGVFLLVFSSTLPVVIPFLVIVEPRPAQRVSSAVAVLMLFLTGYMLGHYIGRNPWFVGLVMLLVGSGLVVISIAFGG